MSNQDSGFPGSQVVHPAVSNNGAPGGTMMPFQQPFAAPSMPTMGGFTPTGPEILHGPLNQTWLMNCLRRRWLLALLMGLLIGGITAGCLLLIVPESISVTAALHVKSKTPITLGTEKPATTKEIEMFAQTQLALLKNNRVLKKALGRTDISQLEAVRKEGSLIDGVQWLTEELRVSYPSKSEILEVRLNGDGEAEELVQVVDAVVAAYLAEVIQKGLTDRDEGYNALQTEHQAVVADLRKKRESYKNLVELHNDPESPSTKNAVTVLMRELDTIRLQQVKNKEELIDIDVYKSTEVDLARSPLALDMRVQEELALDPTIGQYEEELYLYDQQLRQLKSQSKRPTARMKQIESGRQRLEHEMEQYRITAEGKLRQRLKGLPNQQLSQVMIEYNIRKKNLDEQMAILQGEYEAKASKIDELGKESPILIRRKTEIEQLQELDTEIDHKLRNWKVDSGTAEKRVSVFNPATALARSFWERYALVGISGLLAFCVTCYVVALMEFRYRRLNQPSDVEEGLGIRVLGALPSVASRKALAAGSPVAAQVSESIDNVRATLLHESTSKARQVVLITGPVTMEGSTTVASHLAVSLSRAGRRTLLIDGDLRDPSLHKLFGLPLDGGFSEVLRSEIDVADAPRPTTTEGLWLMTAGLCDMDAIHALATDQPQPIFEKLRAEFDFIIIDGAPVLGTSDMLSLGQHVDGAILTVLRDHSEIRKVYQAAELLKSMGIQLLGSVVNGVPQRADRRIIKLHQAAAKRTPQLPAAAATATTTVEA